MEVWLKDDKGSSMFRFPVIPMPLGVDGKASVDTAHIIKKGNVAVFNGIEPNSISLSGRFPKHYYSYCNYRDFPQPYECVDIIDNWKKKGTLLRYIVTETPINMPVIITNFSYEHKDGTGTLYFTLNLMEKESISIPEWVPPQSSSNSNSSVVSNKPRTDNSKSNSKRIHTVKKGEYLAKIAAKYYGNESKYKLIKNNAENQKNYPKLKKSNVIYVGWKLVIP